MTNIIEKIILCVLSMLFRQIKAIFFLLIVSQSTFAQKYDTLSYATVAFDTCLNVVPPGYVGHNAREIYLEIEKKNKRTLKDEFETTEENQRRTNEEFQKPICEQLNINSIYAFKADLVSINYNADQNILNVECKLLPAISNQGHYTQSVN